MDFNTALFRIYIYTIIFFSFELARLSSARAFGLAQQIYYPRFARNYRASLASRKEGAFLPAED